MCHINRARLCLITVVRLMSQTGYDLLTRTEKGKQRSRIIRLIITPTGKFLEVGPNSSFNL